MHYTLDQQSTISSLTVTRHIDHYLGRRYLPGVGGDTVMSAMEM